jgi:hypothetical protein
VTVVRTVGSFVLFVETALGVLDASVGGWELCWAKAQSVLPPARIATKQREPIKLNIHALFVFAMNEMSSGEQFEENKTIQRWNARNGGIDQAGNLSAIMAEFGDGRNDAFVLS